MSHPFNTFALKLKVHCKNCGKKLEKGLLKIKGVRSAKCDQELGKVIISGKVDPAKILSMLENAGREVEFWGEQERPRKDSIVRSEVIDPLNDSDIMAQLEKICDNSSVKSVEVTKTIKVTFKDESRIGPSEKTVEVNTTTNKNAKKTHDHSNGGGLCAASSSCCGGHSDTGHNLDHGCFQYGNATNFGPSCAHGGNSSYNYHCLNSNCTSNGSCYADGIPPAAGPIWSNDNIPSARPLPSAPPLPDDYFQAPPSLAVPDHYYQAPPSPPSSAVPHPYHSVFSDENVNGCIIM